MISSKVEINKLHTDIITLINERIQKKFNYIFLLNHLLYIRFFS
jgi:hypothetical protein